LNVISSQARARIAWQFCCGLECGDGTGYGYEFLDAIVDPDHEEHDRYLEWVGGHFDPKRFDLDATNLALSKIKV
jgi:hypothetical protein